MMLVSVGETPVADRRTMVQFHSSSLNKNCNRCCGNENSSVPLQEFFEIVNRKVRVEIAEIVLQFFTLTVQ
jgi:hypothetical protein